MTGAGLAPGSRFPLILFAPGAAQLPTDYSILLEALASNGYVVAALSPNETGSCAGPGGQSGASDFEKVSLDLLAMLDRLAAPSGHPLAGRLDIGKIAAFGHSRGGAAAVLAAARDPRILAAINLDGDFAGATAEARPVQPILYLTSDPEERTGLSRLFGSAAKDETRRADLWRQVGSRSTHAVSLRIKGSRHLTFTDIALAPPQSVSPRNREARLGSISGPRALAITNNLAVAFLEHHVRGKGLQLPTSYPEVAPFPVEPAAR